MPQRDNEYPPSLRRLLKEIEENGDREPRVFDYWDGRLNEWLDTILGINPYAKKGAPKDIQTWSFPTSALREEYLATIVERDEADIRNLLRHFLFESSTFNSDEDILHSLIRQPQRFRELRDRLEYFRRLPYSILGRKVSAQPGVRWVLDLLEQSPLDAISIIRSYLRVHGATLPDGRIDGLEDAIEIIGGYYINRDLPSQRSALRTIDSREFEVLVANLYKEMGYAVTLTSARRDEGRDVIAEKSSLEGKQRVLIECKLYVRAVVDVQIARALLGVVALERATGGVIVTTGHCEKGVYDLANKDSQFSVIDGENLLIALKKYFGPEWPRRLTWLCSERTL